MVDIHVIPFKFKHLSLLKDMHTSHHNALKVELSMKNLPKIGYIAMLGKQPVAAGFLRRVEPNIGQLDSFLSNPHLGGIIRHIGLQMVTKNLIQDAKDLGLVGVMVFTENKDILKRAQDEGFKVINQLILSRQL